MQEHKPTFDESEEQEESSEQSPGLVYAAAPENSDVEAATGPLTPPDLDQAAAEPEEREEPELVPTGVISVPRVQPSTVKAQPIHVDADAPEAEATTPPGGIPVEAVRSTMASPFHRTQVAEPVSRPPSSSPPPPPPPPLTEEPRAVTPVAVLPAPLPVRAKAPALLWIVTLVALLLAGTSLAVNGLLVYNLIDVQTKGRVLLDDALTTVDNFEFDGFTFDYTFSETIHYSGTVPISRTIEFPFEGDVPFNGVVPITIDIPLLGRQTIRVPVNTSVHVDTVVEVPVQMEFPVQMDVPINMPISVPIAAEQLPIIDSTLESVREMLLRVRATFFE